jgi:hypothetical protein
MWHSIPKEIMDELEALRRFTKRTNNEASITYCKRPHKDKLYIGADFEGDNRGVDIGDCSKHLGTGTRIGDAHSHPVGYDSTGLTPSNQDIFGSMEDAKKQKRPQINCITAPGADLVHCMEPKEVPSRRKLNRYGNNPTARMAINPYILDNFTKDFIVALFDSDSGEKVDSPDPKRVVSNMLGKSPRYLRKVLHEMDYGVFCEYIQDVTVATDDRIQTTCKNELKKRGLLDYLGIQ